MFLPFRFLLPALCAVLISAVSAAPRSGAPKAVIVFLADDLGYGDTGCYGAELIPTPNVDSLAREGLRFTDAHSSSSVCTPSRYALLTGKYPWRKHGTGILPGNAAMIVPTSSEGMTLPSMMKKAGYKTAAIGKWHLGLGRGNVNWNELITPGPKEVGFDESFIMAATADRVPCVYIRNGRVENLDPKDPIEVNYKHNYPGQSTGRNNPELLRMKTTHGHDNTIVNGIGRIGFMKGGKSALWVDQDLADTITKEAVRFIEKNKNTPFFLYFATNDIHVPRDPHQRFIGKSGCGVRGDVTVQMDDSLRQIMQALKKTGLLRDTLLIFTSDNGPIVDDGYADGAGSNLNGHKPAGPLRGGKYSIYEGGTRLPFIAWWPGKIKPGISDALVNHLDIAPSLARLVGCKLPGDSFPDGTDQLPALLGHSPHGRDELVEHQTRNDALALRQGPYKFILNENLPPKERSTSNPGALYNLNSDLGETKDISVQEPQIAEKMAERLRAFKKQAAL